MFGFSKKRKKIKNYYKWEKPKYLLPPIETLSYRGKIKRETREQDIFEDEDIFGTPEETVDSAAGRTQELRLKYEWFQPKSIIPPIETLVPVGIPNVRKPKAWYEIEEELPEEVWEDSEETWEEIKEIEEETAEEINEEIEDEYWGEIEEAEPPAKPQKQFKHRYAHGKRRINYFIVRRLKPKTMWLEKKVQEPETEAWETEKETWETEIEETANEAPVYEKPERNRSSKPERPAVRKDERIRTRPEVRETEREVRKRIMPEIEDEPEVRNVRTRQRQEPELQTVRQQRTPRNQTIRESEMGANSKRRQNRRPY